MGTPEANNYLGSDGDWSGIVGKAKPLFRWAGGKQRFLWEHRDRFPKVTGTYHEPFAGGLSVFFHVAGASREPLQAVIGDVNLRVVRTYEEVKWEPEKVSNKLRQLEVAFNAAEDKVDFYNDVRAMHNRVYPSSDAARFIFLMNTAWNGVFRINTGGHFNVPLGALKGSELRLPTLADITAVSSVLQNAKIRAQSWETSLSAIDAGDFVFLDPPYFHPEDRKDLYEKNRHFSVRDQVKIADALADLQRRGVDFLLTNSAYPEMIDLYNSRGLAVEIINSHRSISSKAGGRGREGELVVTPGSSQLGSAERDAQLELMFGNFASETGN